MDPGRFAALNWNLDVYLKNSPIMTGYATKIEIVAGRRTTRYGNGSWMASRSLDYSLSRPCWCSMRWSIAAAGSFWPLQAHAPSDRCTVFSGCVAVWDSGSHLVCGCRAAMVAEKGIADEMHSDGKSANRLYADRRRFPRPSRVDR